MNPSLKNEISQFIRDIGQKAIHLRTLGFQIDEKGFDDYVTNVDRELDHLLSKHFQDCFPQDIIISEENARSPELWQKLSLNSPQLQNQSQNQSQKQSQQSWFIDPIDGTDDFIHGREFYSVMVGALENAQPIMGWIYAPRIDRLYFGGSALNGLFLSTNGNVPEVLHSHPPIAPHHNRLIVSKKDDLAYGNAIRTAVPHVEFYSLGSFGLKVMEVVQGRASAYIYLNRRVKLWDTVAPIAIAKAAGLVCCDLEGREIGFSYTDINPETLTHNQLIVIGWAQFIETYLEAIAKELRRL